MRRMNIQKKSAGAIRCRQKEDRMKKLTAILITICMILSLAACGSSPASTAEPSGTAGTAESTPAASTEAVPQETYALIAEQTDTEAVAVSTENFTFTKGEMAYFFALTFKNYYSYLSYFGVDATVSLKEQQYTGDQSWFDVFLDEAMSYARNYLVFSEAARDRGIELGQDDLDYIAKQKEEIAEEAATYGWDSETYLEQMFGTNISWEILEAAMQKMLLADKGYNAVNEELRAAISEDDIQQHFEEEKAGFTFIDYVDLNFLDGEKITDSIKAELIKAFSEATDSASFTKAVILYVDSTVDEETIKEAGSSLQYAEQLIGANTKTMQQYVKSDMMDWAFSEERSSDVFVDAEEHDGAQHAYLLKAAPYRDDETYVNVRHILFMTSTLGTAEAARAKAEEMYAKWQAGEKTEDSFADMAAEYSEDSGSASNGGLYEDVYRGEMVEPFENWCFDAARQPGDTGIVDTTYGSHIMYFVSSDTGWHMDVLNDLLDEAYSKTVQELLDKHPITVNEEVLNAINW